MLALLSPAKTLDYESNCPAHAPTQPDFLPEAEALVQILRKKSRPQLRELMKISDALADQNYVRYRDWSLPFNEDNSRAALFAFKGDVYTGFEFSRYGKKELSYAQKHLRILSGLYGVLRPLDLIQPYRLEMGTALKTRGWSSLYDYWDDRLTGSVSRALSSTGTNTIINLASKEYFSAVDPSQIDARVITPHFKDLKNGTYKFLSFYAKKARGMMCDFMIQQNLQEPEALKAFDRDGYTYNSDLSKGDDWVFTRDAVPAANA